MPAPKPPDAPFLPNLYVVARFLDALARPGPEWTRSRLQAAVGVNYDVLRRYVDFLERKGYATVEPREAGDVVRVTPEGRRVRAELLAWIAAFLDGSHLAPGPRRGADPQSHKDGGPSPAPP